MNKYQSQAADYFQLDAAFFYTMARSYYGLKRFKEAVEMQKVAASTSKLARLEMGIKND